MDADRWPNVNRDAVCFIVFGRYEGCRGAIERGRRCALLFCRGPTQAEAPRACRVPAMRETRGRNKFCAWGQFALGAEGIDSIFRPQIVKRKVLKDKEGKTRSSRNLTEAPSKTGACSLAGPPFQAGDPRPTWNRSKWSEDYRIEMGFRKKQSGWLVDQIEFYHRLMYLRLHHLRFPLTASQYRRTRDERQFVSARMLLKPNCLYSTSARFLMPHVHSSYYLGVWYVL